MSVLSATATRARLDTAIATGPEHMRPIMLAVRDAGCALAIIAQGKQRFDVPTSKPVIALIGDDMLESRGPVGFHSRSLRRLLARCRSVSIVSCEPIVLAYATQAAAAAGLGGTSVIIETRMRHEADWHRFVREHAPNAPILIATEQPQGGVH